jgi:hypothetical protein
VCWLGRLLGVSFCLERASEPNGSRANLSASKTVRFVSCCMRIVDRGEWCREVVLFGEEIG